MRPESKYLFPYFVYVRTEGSGETVHMSEFTYVIITKISWAGLWEALIIIKIYALMCFQG